MPAVPITDRGFADAWSPRPTWDICEWCEEHLRLSPKVSPGGRFDLTAHPYWREVLRAAEDPETEEITLVAATRLGKTTTLQAILSYMACLRPAPMMICAPDRDAMRERRDEYYLLCDQSPELHRRLPPPWKRNDQWIDFGHCVCHLAWSGNPQRISGKSCRVVLVTETARCRKVLHEGSFDKLISERTKDWHNFLKMFEGTPTDDECPLWSRFADSDRREYQCPCPHCGHYQQFRFFPHTEGDFQGRGGIAGLRDPDDPQKWRTPDQARELAYYLCEHGCRIDERDRAGMVQRGVWCPAGQTVADDGSLEGTPDRSPRHRGYHLTSQVAEQITFGRMAAEYLDCRDHDDKLRAFFNNWLALRFSAKRNQPKWYQLGVRLRGSHPRGMVPPGALFLASGGDLQKDEAYWIVRAYGEGRTSWLVDWGMVRSEGASPHHLLDQIKAEVLDREWDLVTANVLGETRLRVRRLGMDARYPSLEVTHDWTRQLTDGADSVRLVGGVTRIAGDVPYKPTDLERNSRTGKPYPGGLRLWLINKDHYLAARHVRQQKPLGDPGAWFLTAAPLEECESYLRQILAEAPQEKRNAAGYLVRHWILVDKVAREHYSDCEAYADAMADQVVEGKWENLARRMTPRPKNPVAQREHEKKTFVRKPGRGFGQRRK